MKNLKSITRREFLKISAIGVGNLLFTPRSGLVNSLPAFPAADKIGRICAGGEGAHFDLKKSPFTDSASTGTIFRDDVIPW